MSGGQCTTEECTEITAAHLCHFCTGRLRAALRDLVERALAAELRTAALRQTRMTRPGDTTTREPGDRPMPVDIDAGNLGAALADTLATWVRDVAASMPPHPVEGPVCHQCAGAHHLAPHHTCAEVIGTRPPANHPSALAQWLAANIPHIRTQRFAGQLLDEVTAIIRAVERAVDLPTPSILAGVCPTCDRPVYTRQGATTGRCAAPGCDGMVEVATGRADHLDRLSTTHHTAADAARIITTLGHPITRNRINQWHTRGRLTAASWEPTQTTGQTRPRFLLADIRHLLHQPPTTTKGRTMAAQDKGAPTRYRTEIHTTTGDIHTGPWQTMPPTVAEHAAEKFRPMLEGPINMETDTGDHIIVPARQIATVRVVADPHSRKKTTR